MLQQLQDEAPEELEAATAAFNKVDDQLNSTAAGGRGVRRGSVQIQQMGAVAGQLGIDAGDTVKAMEALDVQNSGCTRPEPEPQKPVSRLTPPSPGIGRSVHLDEFKIWYAQMCKEREQERQAMGV